MNTRILGLAASLTLVTSIAGNANAAEPQGALPQLAGVATLY